uniref:Uncharacterized protein n=1 Tax=Rhizophora mucronata TaxID=61149 RepID=A0A2P2PWB1_RHIMU
MHFVGFHFMLIALFRGTNCALFMEKH